MIAQCACGTVELEATGVPITCVVCHCADCEAGARQIEALPNAPRIREPDGGVAYVAYRKDRVRILKGAERLRAYKLREQSATNRMVTTCCNSGLMLTFDDSKHWVDVFRARVIGTAPPLQMHLCARHRQAEAGDTVPSFPGYPLRFVARLVAAKLGMLLGR